MSDKDLNCLPIRIKANRGIAQWNKAEWAGYQPDPDTGKLKPYVQIPLLTPGTIIFVHGVNSEGEWYEEAMKQFCSGLNTRLGRGKEDLKPARYDKETKRFSFFDAARKRIKSPIIPFYWGWSRNRSDPNRYEGIYYSEDPNPYGSRPIEAWGGGAFQNGTNNLLSLWKGGFKKKILSGLVDLQSLNPEIERCLVDAPPRDYMIHAARRLAYLIEDIRTNFPNEPLNIIAHSQGCMITLCAMLFLKKEVRAPDTLLLNSAPYAFTHQFSDYLSAANGWGEVQSDAARLKTFQNIAERMVKDAGRYPQDEVKECDCLLPRTEGIDEVWAHYEPQYEHWYRHIGGQLRAGNSGDSPYAGKNWWDSDLHSRKSFDYNRGKIFVNSNPNDRIIGVAVVQGMGWRGIPSNLLAGPPDARHYQERANVKAYNAFAQNNVCQRIFARNSDGKEVPETRHGSVMDDGKQDKLVHPPAIGARTDYWFRYFHVKQISAPVTTDDGIAVRLGEGGALHTQNPYLFAYDGAPGFDFWNPLPKKVLRLVPVQGTPGEHESIWINAPKVPEPAVLKEDFNAGVVRFDGLADARHPENVAQQADFALFKKFYPWPDGKPATAQECEDFFKKLGEKEIAQTNHSEFLTYGSVPGQAQAVAQVLAYDLCIGQGYAWEDPEYWAYVLALADWKKSDPYYRSGQLQPVAMPEGLEQETEFVDPKVLEEQDVGA